MNKINGQKTYWYKVQVLVAYNSSYSSLTPSTPMINQKQRKKTKEARTNSNPKHKQNIKHLACSYMHKQNRKKKNLKWEQDREDTEDSLNQVYSSSFVQIPEEKEKEKKKAENVDVAVRRFDKGRKSMGTELFY